MTKWSFCRKRAIVILGVYHPPPINTISHLPLSIYSQGFFLQSSTVPWLNNKLNKWTVIHIQLYIRWARQFPYDWMMWRIDKKREFMIFWIFLIQPNFFKTCRIHLDNIKIYISVNTVEGYCLKKLLVTIELILQFLLEK